jgi:hypothetical protein
MSKILRNTVLVLGLSFGTVTVVSAFLDVPVAEAAGKKKAKKGAKVTVAKKVAASKNCGTYMYRDKTGNCADARAKK